LPCESQQLEEMQLCLMPSLAQWHVGYRRFPRSNCVTSAVSGVIRYPCATPYSKLNIAMPTHTLLIWGPRHQVISFSLHILPLLLLGSRDAVENATLFGPVVSCNGAKMGAFSSLSTHCRCHSLAVAMDGSWKCQVVRPYRGLKRGENVSISHN
jgi:hypothetical protein